MLNDIDMMTPDPLPDGVHGSEKDQNTEAQEPKSEEQVRAEYFITDLDKKLIAEGVAVALIAIIDPKTHQPIVYNRGTSYQLAKLGASLTRYFKDQLNKELET